MRRQGAREEGRWGRRGGLGFAFPSSRTLGRAPRHYGHCFLSASALSLSPFPEKKLFDPDDSDNYAAFKNWLQCYLVPGMSSLRDRNGRTIWFQVGVWGRCMGLGPPPPTTPPRGHQPIFCFPRPPQHYAVSLEGLPSPPDCCDSWTWR